MPRPTSFALILLLLAVVRPAAAEASVTAPWVVDAEEAARWIQDESATVLDTRSAVRYRLGHVEGAVRVSWQDFSRSEAAERGKLLPEAALQKAIRTIGVSAERPVVVVGNPPDDWGEDGRIVWMLRYAGHTRVALVNGGYDALKETGLPTAIRAPSPPKSEFEVRFDRSLTASAEQVLASSKASDRVLLDTREEREFRGKTPYGEQRGGHVPGAKHLHFQELLGENGQLLSRKMIRRKLGAMGVTEDTPVIAYCTGGVRSGWMVAALRWAGFSDVRNYPGSMWEWAAGEPDARPLATE